MNELLTNKSEGLTIDRYAAKYGLNNDELPYLDVDLVQQEMRAQLAVKALGEKNGN